MTAPNKSFPAATTANLFPAWARIAAVVIFAAVILIILFFFLKDVLMTIFSKEVTTTATLVSKTAQPYVTKKVFMQQQGNVAGGIAEKGMEYSFYFQLENGNHLSFLVPKDTYDVALENANGRLTYKGNRFISFTGATEGTRLRNEQNQNDFVSIKDTF